MLTAVTFFPVLGAALILLINKERKDLIRKTAVVFSGLAFVVTVWAYFRFSTGTADMQFVERVNWIPAIGIHYALGVDGLSMPLVLLTTLLSLVSLIASFGIENRVKEYFFWFLLLETGMTGVFVSLD